MKKMVSISLLILISFTGISVKFAAHYCQGIRVATKISFSGKTVGCGMEYQEAGTTGSTVLKALCCEDTGSEYTINNIFVPSVTGGNPFLNKSVNPVYYIPGHLTLKEPEVKHLPIIIRPPGQIFLNANLQPILCSFLI